MKCRHTKLYRERKISRRKSNYVEVSYCPDCGSQMTRTRYLRADIAVNPLHHRSTFNPFNGKKIKVENCEGMNMRNHDLGFEVKYAGIEKMTLDELFDHYYESIFSESDLEIKGFEWFKWKFFDLRMKYL